MCSGFPKISIITPSFNQGQFIEQTIDSVLSQNYPNLEYIIVDGGSTDNTREIIKKYEKHLKYWVSEPDSGQSNAINKGFKYASGDLINWINSDDWYQPGAFNELSRLAGEYPEKLVFAFKERRIFENGDMEYNQTPLFNNLGEAVFYSEIDQPATFFRKKVWDELFPLKEGLHYIMDGELWLRYLLKYGFEHIFKSNFEVVNFRVHEDSKTTQNEVNQGFLKDRTAIVRAVLEECNLADPLIDLVCQYYFLESGYTDIQLNYAVDYKKKAAIYKYFVRKAAITAINKRENKHARMAAWQLLKHHVEIVFALNVIRKTVF